MEFKDIKFRSCLRGVFKSTLACLTMRSLPLNGYVFPFLVKHPLQSSLTHLFGVCMDNISDDKTLNVIKQCSVTGETIGDGLK